MILHFGGDYDYEEEEKGEDDDEEELKMKVAHMASLLGQHPSSISLSNVSFCVLIFGTKNGTCLSDAPALRGFQRRTLTYSFLRGLAAPVIGKVRVLCYEFTGVTLA